MRIEREFLELQRRFEARLVPGLSEEQQLEFLDKNPTLLRFKDATSDPPLLIGERVQVGLIRGNVPQGVSE